HLKAPNINYVNKYYKNNDPKEYYIAFNELIYHLEETKNNIYLFYWIDWIPARLTAAAFAVVGNFEDAIFAWRNFADRWKNETDGIILSAGGGAMGVLLGTPDENASTILPVDAGTVDASELEADTLPGDAPTPRALQSTVGLVWRALLLWMFLLLLLSVVVWVA
ncbi:MAG: regulatory signaling modulator protein AmpE, partial [Glaciimonas sp.]|nr:regulatory signaling modulator protein AmpE [Glaciimonas sp.]